MKLVDKTLKVTDKTFKVMDSPTLFIYQKDRARGYIIQLTRGTSGSGLDCHGYCSDCHSDKDDDA